MKKVCVLFLILFSFTLVFFTAYTLMNQDIKKDQIIKKIKSVEKATSNRTENELNETYNIELNGKRHKLKCNYHVNFEEKNIELTLYLDGFKILNQLLAENIKDTQIEDIFNEEENNLLITESNIYIINTDTNYLLVEVNSNIDHEKSEYFVWNEDRKIILEHILTYDSNITLNINDEETTSLARISDNNIYVFEKTEDMIEEYVYKINKDKATKELVNTYK